MMRQEKNKRKTLIIIPSQAAFDKEKTGIERYLYQLLREWLKIKPEGVKFLLYLKKKPLPDRELLKNSFFKTKVIRFPFGWTILRLSLEILRIALQYKFSVNFQRKFSDFVLFIPAHVMPLIHPKRTIVTIHGLEYEYFPQCYSWFSRNYLRWSTQYACKHAYKIIAVSENTKNDLVKLYGCDVKNINVIWHGVETPINTNRKANKRKRIGVNSLSNLRYFVYLGRIELKKNIIGIIKAFEILRDTSPRHRLKDYKLVLAGGPGYGFEKIKNKIEKIKNTNRKLKNSIILTGHIEREKKWQLLKNAQALVFPSHYEGFGLPILEAQSVGIPVITSKNSSMEEITTINRESLIVNRESKNTKYKIQNTKGKIPDSSSALLVNPNKAQEIADVMNRIISDKKLRDRIIKAGYENIKRFSWKKCALKTLQVLTQTYTDKKTDLDG